MDATEKPLTLTPAQWDALGRIGRLGYATTTDYWRTYAGVQPATLKALRSRGLVIHFDYVWQITRAGRAALNGR